MLPAPRMMTMKIRGYALLLALLAAVSLAPGSAAGEISINYSFNESHAEIHQQMLERNASFGEYYEQVCPEYLESMPPDVRAHLYSTTMARYGDLASGREFVPPLEIGNVAITTASPVISVFGVPVTLVTLGLAALGILILLTGVLLVRERLRDRNK